MDSREAREILKLYRAGLDDADPLFTDALNAAEQVLPTCWRNNAARLQAFYSLWEHAEAAKIKLGGRREPGAEPADFELGEAVAGPIAARRVGSVDAALKVLPGLVDVLGGG